MNTRELFEMASLDVLGLLDEQEREAFEIAFRQASPAIQAQIRREQLRFSEIESSLPDVQPPAGLRARVVAAVRDAIAAVRTEPIATIGPNPRVAYSSAPLWRAACIGFASASLVLGGFFYKVSEHNKTITDSLTSTALIEQIRRLSESGADWRETIAAPGLKLVDFAPTAQDADPVGPELFARIFFNPEKKEAILICEGLPIDSNDYKLIIKGSEDSKPVEFPATPGLVQVTLKSIDLEGLDGFEIQAPVAADGIEPTVLLRASTL